MNSRTQEVSMKVLENLCVPDLEPQSPETLEAVLHETGVEVPVACGCDRVGSRTKRKSMMKISYERSCCSRLCTDNQLDESSADANSNCKACDANSNCKTCDLYTCASVHLHIWISASLHICTCAPAYLCKCVPVYMCICAPVRLTTVVRMYMRAHVPVYV